MILNPFCTLPTSLMLAAVLFALPGASAKAAAVVNIRASVSGYDPATGFTNPVIVTLPAGTYKLSDAASASAAHFQAFNKHYHAHDDWYWNFSVGDASSGALLVSVGSTQTFPNRSHAARAGGRLVPQTLTLAATTTLWFAVNDNFLPDNMGGISVQISPQ